MSLDEGEAGGAVQRCKGYAANQDAGSIVGANKRGPSPRRGAGRYDMGGALFGDATMGALLTAMSRARGDDRLRMATWNPR